jgi:hypothetical protein
MNTGNISIKIFLQWRRDINGNETVLCSPYYLDYNKDSQTFAASFVNGTAEFGLFITQERIGLAENLRNQESCRWKINH